MREREADKKQRIGVFGGTFDPVHDGHIKMAQFVLDQGVVDRILFIPAAHPPHKSAAKAAFSHRVNMLRTAIVGLPRMAVSLLESKRQSPSYTVDSLQVLRQELPSALLFFVLGGDSLLDLHHWYHYSNLFQLAELVVVARSGLADELCHLAIMELPGSFIPDAACRIWTRNDGARIWYLTGFTSNISSSDVRHTLEHQGCPDGVDPAVLAYIRKHHLYEKPREPCVT